MIGSYTATGVVIASMVGTGVFVSLGFQAEKIDSTFALMALWVLGGAYALTGALCYAELASRMPRSGGEYNFLSKIYHPSLGFLAGWISVIVGFAAPTAVTALAFGQYTQLLNIEINKLNAAIVVILLCGCIHLSQGVIGRGFQNVLTLVKIVLLIAFIGSFFLLSSSVQPVNLWPSSEDFSAIGTNDFAVAFVFVTYAYSGWNAAVYCSGDIREARFSVPFALCIGTLVVTVLYLLLNFAFLRSIPFGEIQTLINKEEIAALGGRMLFEEQGEVFVNALISIGLISTIGALVFIGPRISQTIGTDFKALSFLSRKNAKGIPVNAILLQLALSILFVVFLELESLLVYTEFSLILFSTLTVMGLFVLRIREKGSSFDGYRAWGFPWTGIFFVAMSGWVLFSVYDKHPKESNAGLLTILAGLVIYCVVNPKKCDEER